MKSLSQIEHHDEVVARQPVGLVEEQEPQAAGGAPDAQQVGVALPLGEHDHHDRGADADRLAGRQPGRAGGLPVGGGLTADLDGELEVLAVVEQALAAGAAAAVAPEDLVERLLDRDRRQEQQLLSLAESQRAQDLLHAIDPAQLDADAAHAAELDAVEVLVEPADLAGGAAELDVDAARDVLGSATQIVLLAGEPALEHVEVAAQPLERGERLVDLDDLGRDAMAEPDAGQLP